MARNYKRQFQLLSCLDQSWRRECADAAHQVVHVASSLAARSAVCLFAPPAGDDNEYGVQISCEDEAVDHLIDRGRVHQLLVEAFAGLDEHGRDFVARRNFNEGGQPSQDSISSDFGVSRERISQIEIEAMPHTGNDELRFIATELVSSARESSGVGWWQRNDVPA